ncbi:MAG: hypothetical protein HQM12_18870 [SAR324 cluster bacterium]|nr:hypothetical protein [SAR324 cluster bacterium]
MNDKLKKIMIGSGSIINLYPINPAIPRKRVPLPYSPNTDSGFSQDWQKTGQDLWKAFNKFQQQIDNGEIKTS